MSGIYSLGFFGRPLPGTLRMASKAEESYSGDFVLGLIPAIIKRCRTVACFKPSSSAISFTVKPSIILISVNLTDLLIFFKNLIKSC